MNMDSELGFTLIEAMITLVVISILLAAAVPYFGDFTKNNRLSAQTNDLVSSLQLARSEAIKRGSNTVVCPSSDQVTCSADSDDWLNGWLVYSDVNLNNILEPGAGTPLCEAAEDCVMRTSAGLGGGNTLNTAAVRVRYLPTGMADNDGTIDFTIVSRDCKGDQSRRVRVTTQGHTLVSNVDCP